MRFENRRELSYMWSERLLVSVGAVCVTVMKVEEADSASLGE